MATSNSKLMNQLPDEMLAFTSRQLETAQLGPRLGQLVSGGRQIVSTPHYVVPTSRGVVPHIGHDMLQRHTRISATYLALEDFIEKSESPREAPIFKTPTPQNMSPLRQYISLPDIALSILGPRRVPAIICPSQNTNSSISISTSVGFRYLRTEDYIDACHYLKPDITISLVDLVQADKISSKRIEKSADRSHAWLRETLSTDEDDQRPKTLFGSIPPLEKEQQSFYLAELRDEFGPHLSGLSLYSPSTVDAIPKDLTHLPRLCLTDPPSPHAILAALAIGVDLITTPFATQASEHGMGFSFFFPPPDSAQDEPLALDLWSPSHATSLEPLTPNCACYTCTHHHRAFVHHLLQAKEMLAWTLLQIHNFSVLDSFFTQIRASIVRGTFEADVATFSRAYHSEMPEQTGQGPRVRGYQMKSVGGGELKKNPKAYGRLDDQLQKSAEADEGIARPEVTSGKLEQQGFEEKAENILKEQGRV